MRVLVGDSDSNDLKNFVLRIRLVDSEFSTKNFFI